MVHQDEFKFDVAFSFLSVDLPLARQLSDGLAPGLSSFVYDRKKEELLGTDGMDAFARVFGQDARLTVILHREGWSTTPWTAFEESHIKDRALHSRMNSFIVVKLDDVPLPLWVPETHLYASLSTETVDDILAVIRVRARQQGATTRRETVAQQVLRKQREDEAERLRRERETSPDGLAELHDEVCRLFNDVGASVDEVRQGNLALNIEFGSNDLECAIARQQCSTSAAWLQPSGNSLRNARLRINDWRGRVQVPRSNSPQTVTGSHIGAIHFVPSVSSSDEWVWRHDSSLDDQNSDGLYRLLSGLSPEEFRTSELADFIVKRHFEKC